jgi:plasmid stabilization system protein ParE
MIKYKVVASEQVQDDFRDLYRCVVFEYKAPATAFMYMRGLRKTIHSLETFPTMHAVRSNQSLQKYGFEVRRVNYKKMAITYTIHGNVVFIHRIVAGSMIAGL